MPDKYRDALEDVAWQFAYRVDGTDGHRRMSSGSLSALEDAFKVLGWDDPWIDPPDTGCARCYRFATCGAPTPDGYQRLCFDHYQEVTNA